jgi:hypothetical protein
MNEFNYATLTGFIVIAFVLSAFVMILLSAGCIPAGKQIYADATATPIPTPTPSPTPTEAPITPEPTPEAIPTLNIEYVDPFAAGARSENQWYKWYRPDVQGLKDLQIGIVVYRHRFLDRYTWWNPSTGNYFTQRPAPGYRYFAVWVHQEMIGTNQTDDPSFWSFDSNAFALQVGTTIYTHQINGTYNPVVRIKEFDDYTDYYNTITAPPFGYYIKYTGVNPDTGGFRAEKLGWLRMGQGNAIDGFILYEIPKESQTRDIQLLGEFGTFGSAQWIFPGR